MKLVKGLLLASAASLTAIAGAQAADLPVKAKAVEYVKICSVYGEGFFYIPGTDTCIKLGGMVRWDGYFGAHPLGSDAPLWAGGGPNSLSAQALGAANSGFMQQTTVLMSTDVRTQTEYGTLRAYARYGLRSRSGTGDGQSSMVYSERYFLQFGGLTAGKQTSTFDFFSGAFSYAGQPYTGGGDAYAFGVNLISYTQEFGNGVSGTIAVEDASERRSFIWDATQGANTSGVASAVNALQFGALPGPNVQTGIIPYDSCGASLVTNDAGSATLGACGAGDYAGAQVPDFVGQLRITQAWGSAQIMAASHQNRASYYGNDALSPIAGGFSATATVPNGTWTGVAPSSKYGFAVGGGLLLNVPTGAGDKFWVEGVYSQGATSYLGQGASPGTRAPFVMHGSTATGGWTVDSVFANLNTCVTTSPTACAVNGTGLQLTEGFTIGSAFEHYWQPNLRSSVFGAYTGYRFNDTAKALMCSSSNNGIAAINGNTKQDVKTGLITAGCNPNFNIWTVGTRTVWNPVRNLDVGFEVYYSELENKMDSNLVAYKFGGSGTTSPGLYTPHNQGDWIGMVRLQRSFWP